ncbi:MAG TPA: hypothetical protein VJZ26_19045 [Blastocatellia bacterium]|nr:hypothetical protein [Blastocatellia bacterium]
MPKKLAIILLMVFVHGCALRSHEAPPEDVDKAAALFFKRLNDAEYETIYKDAAKKFKQNQTKEKIIESLKELTAKGRVQQYQRVKMTFEGEGADTRADPVYSTLFEQAKGDIILNFVDESGEWKLIGFAFKQRG